MSQRISKIIMTVFILTLSGILSIPLTARGQVQGIVKDYNNAGLPYVRIISDDGYTCCSDSSGWYSLELASGSRSITFRKKGCKLRTTSIPINNQTTAISNIYLEKSISANDISGFVGIRKEGVAVKLYKLIGGAYSQTPADTAITCADGMYSFPEPGIGTYKVVPECSVCAFSPAFNGGITVPVSNQYNFTAICSPGACQ